MQTLVDRFRDNRPRGPDYEQDRELAARFIEGDREAPARIVDRHAGAIYRYLARRVGPGNDALVAEVVEAAFEEAFRNISQYASGRATLPLRLKLFRAANKHIARRRRRVAGANADSEESEELVSLRLEMLKLPARHQTVLALALIEEMPPNDMAGVLRTTPSGAMRRLRSALRRLGKQHEALI